MVDDITSIQDPDTTQDPTVDNPQDPNTSTPNDTGDPTDPGSGPENPDTTNPGDTTPTEDLTNPTDPPPEDPPPEEPTPEEPNPPTIYLTLSSAETEISSIGEVINFTATIQNVTQQTGYITTSNVSSSLVGVIATNVSLNVFETASFNYQYSVTESDVLQANLVESVTATGGSTIVTQSVSIPVVYSIPPPPKPLSFSGPGNISFNGSIKIIK